MPPQVFSYLCVLENVTFFLSFFCICIKEARFVVFCILYPYEEVIYM